MSVEIQLSEDATEVERLRVLTPLLAYNLANGGDDAHETLALLLCDSGSNEVIGGLYGKISYLWLLVPEPMRGRGIGERLMRMAEEIAQGRSCTSVWLETFSFQAPDFIKLRVRTSRRLPIRTYAVVLPEDFVLTAIWIYSYGRAVNSLEPICPRPSPVMNPRGKV